MQFFSKLFVGALCLTLAACSSAKKTAPVNAPSVASTPAVVAPAPVVAASVSATPVVAASAPEAMEDDMLMGKWDTTAESPGGTVEGPMTFVKENGVYKGTLDVMGGSFEIKDVVIKGTKVKFLLANAPDGNGGATNYDFNGTMEEGKIVGELTGMFTIPVRATKRQ
jgi:hypothetical protein